MSTLSSSLWDHDDITLADLGIDTPEWIEPVSPADIAAICQGGCDSGAYMPAVTTWKAMRTMADHGDDVLEYLEENLDEIPSVPAGSSWSGLACFYLSIAVERWAASVHDEIERALPDYLRNRHAKLIADGVRGMDDQCDHALSVEEVWHAFCDHLDLDDDIRASGCLPVDWTTEDVADVLDGLAVELDGIDGMLEWTDGDLMWYPEV